MIDLTKKNLKIKNYIINKSLPWQNITGKNPIVLIGRSEIGPKYIPIKANNLSMVANVFGKDSELTDAYIECVNSGGKNIYLVKINGTNAVMHLYDDLSNPILSLESIYAGELYNQAFIRVRENDGIKLLDITSYYSTNANTYNLNELTLKELAFAINKECLYGDSEVWASPLVDGETSSSLLSLGDRNMVLGSSEEDMTDDEYIGNINYVLNNLKMVDSRFIGIINAGFYKKDAEGTFLYSHINSFTQEMNNNGSPCFVTLGLDLSNYDSSWRTNVGSFIEYAEPIAEGTVNDRPAGYTISEYTNLLLAKLKTSNTLALDGWNVSDGVASYCGLMDALEVGESTTNRKIPNAYSDELKLYDADIKDYADKGFVVCNGTLRRGFRFYKGINYLKLLDGKTYEQAYDEELGKVVSVEVTKPIAITKFSNINFIADFRREIARGLEPILGTIQNKEDILTVTDKIVNKYPNIVRDYNLEVEQLDEISTVNYSLIIDLEIYGEVESINVSIAV